MSFADIIGAVGVRDGVELAGVAVSGRGHRYKVDPEPVELPPEPTEPPEPTVPELTVYFIPDRFNDYDSASTAEFVDRGPDVRGRDDERFADWEPGTPVGLPPQRIFEPEPVDVASESASLWVDSSQPVEAPTSTRAERRALAAVDAQARADLDARAEADARAREADARARAEADALAAAQAEADALAEAEYRARAAVLAEEEATARAEADARTRAAAKAEADAKARAAALAEADAKARAAALAEADANAEVERRARAAAQVQAEANARAEAEKRAADRRRREAAEAKKLEAKKREPEKTESRSLEPSPVASQPKSSEPRTRAERRAREQKQPQTRPAKSKSVATLRNKPIRRPLVEVVRGRKAIVAAAALAIVAVGAAGYLLTTSGSTEPSAGFDNGYAVRSAGAQETATETATGAATEQPQADAPSPAAVVPQIYPKVNGVVTTNDGSTIVITQVGRNQITVVTDGDTQVSGPGASTVGDLAAGQQVSVTGTRTSLGTFAAETIEQK